MPVLDLCWKVVRFVCLFFVVCGFFFFGGGGRGVGGWATEMISVRSC